ASPRSPTTSRICATINRWCRRRTPASRPAASWTSCSPRCSTRKWPPTPTARALVGAEVTGQPAPPPALWGMSGDEIRDATHHTHELYGVPFMYPDVRQGPVIAKLALARAVAREAELAALAAFPPGAGLSTARPARPDLAHALNRISSALYLLAVRYVAGLYQGARRPFGPVRGWKPP